VGSKPILNVLFSLFRVSGWIGWVWGRCECVSFYLVQGFAYRRLFLRFYERLPPFLPGIHFWRSRLGLRVVGVDRGSQSWWTWWVHFALAGVVGRWWLRGVSAGRWGGRHVLRWVHCMVASHGARSIRAFVATAGWIICGYRICN
jgi:hypothetical protein